jgi:ABC-type sulfate/molybdate transport systems ATPase subunit
MVFVTHSIEEAVLMGDRIVVLKGRPSSVHEVVEVDLPRPRDRATLQLPRFAELREQVWGTLMADARKGRRPSYSEAAPPEAAKPLYQRFVELLGASVGRVETGVFQARMRVSYVNEGPVTILLDSRKAF